MCGIFGIYGADDSARTTAAALHALQHRGQEAFGIAVASRDGRIQTARKIGLVSDSLARRDFLNALSGTSAIGHVRYSTAGKKDGTDTERTRNAQPLQTMLSLGEIAIVHNGTLTNAQTLKQALLERGRTFQSDTDTEVALKLIGADFGEKLMVECVKRMLPVLEGAFAFILLTPEKLIGVRDKHGIRPLVLGKRNSEYILASETCALDVIGAEYVREVEPGEVIVIDNNGFTSHRFCARTKHQPCIFEFAYIARPDSLVFGSSATGVRSDIGRVLAHEHSVDADIVVPVPDSGVPAALGYAREMKMSLEPLGFIRSHYVGRTFIEANQCARIEKIDLKLTANKYVVANKRVVLVDDSLVRGNTMRLVVARVRKAGAKEVHLRIAYPPWRYPCFGGIDTPTVEELFAYDCKTDEEVMQKVCKEIGADSVGFISLEGLYTACHKSYDASNPTFCDACLTGNYPMRLIDKR